MDARQVATLMLAATLAVSSGPLTVSGATLTGGTDGGQTDLSAIPVSSDTQVISRRIYRDLNGDRIYLFVAQIDDNSTTTYADNTADTARGTAQPPLAGDELIDHSVPGRCYAASVHEGRVIAVDADTAVSESNESNNVVLSHCLLPGT